MEEKTLIINEEAMTGYLMDMAHLNSLAHMDNIKYLGNIMDDNT
jgi:hypothetical protein